MFTILSHQPSYRTRLTTLPAAARFARMLANNSRFTGVEIVRSRQARSEVACWFVAYQPASEARQAALIEKQGERDQAKADEEGADYEITRDAQGYQVRNPRSGESYRCSESHCTCGQWEHRLRKMPAAACKHMRALRSRVAAERTHREMLRARRKVDFPEFD